MTSGLIQVGCWARSVDLLLKFGNLDQTNGKCSFVHDAKYTLHCDSYVDMCFLSPSLEREGINRFLCVYRLHQHLHWHDTHLCARFHLNKLTDSYQTNVCICSAQSKNRYNSRIVLRKVGILTLLRNVGILTLRNTILELLPRKVRIGTKWESHFISFI